MKNTWILGPSTLERAIKIFWSFETTLLVDKKNLKELQIATFYPKNLIFLILTANLDPKKSILKPKFTVFFLSCYSPFLRGSCVKISIRFLSSITLSIPSVLDFWKSKLEKASSMNWIFTACVACKNQFQNQFLHINNPVNQT